MTNGSPVAVLLGWKLPLASHLHMAGRGLRTLRECTFSRPEIRQTCEEGSSLLIDVRFFFCKAEILGQLFSPPGSTCRLHGVSNMLKVFSQHDIVQTCRNL